MKRISKNILCLLLTLGLVFTMGIFSFADDFTVDEPIAVEAQGIATAAADYVPGMSIKYVQVMNGGATQAIYKDGRNYDVSLYTVYKGDDPELAVNGENPNLYYTTARNPNHQDHRTFTFQIVLDKGDYTGIGTGTGEFNPAGVNFTYTVGTSNWNGINSQTNKSAVIDGDYIIFTADVLMATGGNAANNTSVNIPYSPYYSQGRPSSTQYGRIGTAPIRATYGGATIGQMDLHMSINDSFYLWSETDAFAKNYIATYGADGGTDYSACGRYMRFESLGKTTGGRDIWASIISDSKASVDEYLNVTQPLMNSDPALLESQLAGGHQKSVLLFNAIHGNEVEGNGILADMRERLLQKESWKFTARKPEFTQRVLPTSNSSQSGGTRVIAANRWDKNSIVDLELDVDEFLDKFIVVLVYYSNADGNSAPRRENNYGQDPNRDGGIFAYVETRAMSKALTKWDPFYVLEFHDNVQGLLIDGTTPPMEPSLEADLIENYEYDLIDAIGMSAIGLSAFNNYFLPTRDQVQGWDNGAVIYTPAMAMMCGALGGTMECPNNTQDNNDAILQGMFGLFKHCLDDRNGIFANKLEFKRRGVENIDSKELVDPLLTNIHKFIDDIRSRVSFNIPATVSQPRPRLKDADGNELSFFPDYYVLPVDTALQFSPAGAVQALVDLNELGGVQVDRTTEAVTFDGVTYPVGTYVINMKQARRTFANTLLYPGFDANIYGSALYDGNTIISWPGQKGFNATRLWAPDLFTGKTEPVNMTKQVELPGDGEYVVYTNSGQDAVRLTNRLLSSNCDAWMVTGYVPGAAIGDIVARRADVLAKVGPLENEIFGPLALSVFGIDGGNTVPVNTKKLVRPSIATSRPSGNTLRYAYDALEFTYGFSTTIGSNSVYVGTSASTNATVPQFIYSAAGATVNGANLLGTGAVTATSANGSQAEMLGNAVWSGSSIVASNFGLFDQVFQYTNNKYSNLRSDVKPLAAYTNSNIYLSGRKGVVAGNNAANRGLVMAVTGIKANGTPITCVTENMVDRDRYQVPWCLMANSIFAYASGIADIPRPTVTVDTGSIETGVDFDVALGIRAEDTAGVNATVAVKKYKVNDTLLEPVYDPADPAWADIPAGDKVTVFDVNDVGGEYYLHWYVENSKGVATQGNSGPYVKVPVGVALSVPEVSGIEGDVCYTLSLSRAGNVLNLELEFLIDGNLLAFLELEPLNGFKEVDGIAWQSLGGDLWRGSVTLGYPSGDGTGLTNKGTVDIANFVFAPRAIGEATMKLTDVKVTGLRNELTTYIDFITEAGEATTFIDKLIYSKYDLNKDGIVDALDLGMMLLYCGFNKDSADWNTLVKVNDIKGNGVTASMCDVNGDGIIDMLDLLDLFIHYTK